MSTYCFHPPISHAPKEISPKHFYSPNMSISHNKTADTEPAATKASHVPTIWLNTAAFVLLEMGTEGPVVLAAATAELLTKLNVLVDAGTGIVALAIV